MLKNKNLTILDIGSKKISLFIGSKSVNDIYLVKIKSEIEYAGFAEGQWLDFKNLGTTINRLVKQTERKHNLKIKKIYLGVPGEFTSVICNEINMKFPKPHIITANDLDKLYTKGNIYENKNKYVAINSAPIFYTLDNETRLVDPIGSTVKEIKGMISYILADKIFYDTMSDICEKIGLREVEFISANWAEGMYLFDDDVRDRFVLLADIGYITSTITLFRGDGIVFQRSFSLGGGHIDADILRVLDTSYDEAIALRNKVNLSLQPNEDDKYQVLINNQITDISVSHVQNIVSARVLDFADMINECMAKCEYDCPAYVPLHLTGGGITNIRGAKDIIAKNIGRSVEVTAPKTPELNKPCYSSSIGLLHIANRLEERKSTFKKIINKIFR